MLHFNSHLPKLPWTRLLDWKFDHYAQENNSYVELCELHNDFQAEKLPSNETAPDKPWKGKYKQSPWFPTMVENLFREDQNYSDIPFAYLSGHLPFIAQSRNFQVLRAHNFLGGNCLPPFFSGYHNPVTLYLLILKLSQKKSPQWCICV